MRSLLILLVLAPVLALGQQKARFTPETLFKFGRVAEEQVSPDGRLVVYTITRYDIAANKGERDVYVAALGGPNMKTRPPQNLTAEKGSEFGPQWRPDGLKIGYLAEQEGKVQVWEMDPNGGNKRCVSQAAVDVEGFRYVPGGRHVLLLMAARLDTTPAERYADAPASKARVIEGLLYRHWTGWHGPSYTHPFIAPYMDGKVGAAKDLMPGERQDAPLPPFQGIEEVVASPDGKTVVYTCRKETGAARALSTNSDLYAYDIATGKTRNLTEGNMGYDQHPAFSPDGRRLAYSSMAQAGNEADKPRLMVLTLGTGERQDLTAAFEEGIASAPVWQADGRGLYVCVHQQGTEQVYAFALPTVASSKGKAAPAAVAPPRQLTKGIHNYGAVALAEGGRLLCPRTAMDAPADLFVVDPQTGDGQNLTRANEALLANLALSQVTQRQVQTSDGKQMLVWHILPPGFDAAKKYPALLFCQGGPQSPLSQTFSYRWNMMALSAPGYVIVAPCRRGMPGFGRAWNDDISGDWGGQPMRDYLAAIDDAAKLPYIDKDRLAAVGASYGGYSVYYLAGIHEKRFKAFISHAGVYDLESMYGQTEELFFADHEMGGPPWAKPQPKSYAAYNPRLLVDRWDTPILVIHGALDYRVPEGQGMEAYTAAQVRGVPSRFVHFPDEGHWILKPQNSLVWHREFFGWLERYLR